LALRHKKKRNHFLAWLEEIQKEKEKVRLISIIVNLILERIKEREERW
jgi:hypothetical protein